MCGEGAKGRKRSHLRKFPKLACPEISKSLQAWEKEYSNYNEDRLKIKGFLKTVTFEPLEDIEKH